VSRRKRISEMSDAELIVYEQSENYRIGRTDAFDHGNPETVLEYWERDAPTHDELLSIVRNLLRRVR
jgi:hypothetical protein